MNNNLIGAGVICQLAIRILALMAATESIGSWWMALSAVAILDWIEGAGKRELDQWRAPKT